MTKDQLLKFHAEMTQKMSKLVKVKNEDYSSNSSDAFANFKAVETWGVCKAEVGFLTRMADKFGRITSLLAESNKAKVNNETVQDTLLDLANYCILLSAYIESNNVVEEVDEYEVVEPIKKPRKPRTKKLKVTEDSEYSEEEASPYKN